MMNKMKGNRKVAFLFYAIIEVWNPIFLRF